MKARCEFEQQTMQLIALPIPSANSVLPEKTRKPLDKIPLLSNYMTVIYKLQPFHSLNIYNKSLQNLYQEKSTKNSHNLGHNWMPWTNAQCSNTTD